MRRWPAIAALAIVTPCVLWLVWPRADGRGEAPPRALPTSSATGPGDGAAAVADPVEAAARTAAATAPPPAGISRAADGTWSLHFEARDRREVIDELAERASFEVADHATDSPALSFDLDGLSLEEALARILEPTPYSVLYGVDGRRDTLAIARVVVDPEAAPSGLRDVEGLDAKLRDKLRRRRREKAARELGAGEDGGTAAAAAASELDAVAQRAAMDARAEREQLQHAQTLLELQSDDPRVRADAAALLDPENSEDARILGDALRSDPDSRVRREAADQLSYAPRNEAVPLLREALRDESAEVVSTALMSLGFVGDPSALDDVRAFLDHPSPDVRAAAKDATTMLETPLD